jgi:hypothetical protein
MQLATMKPASRPNMPGLDTPPAACWVACHDLLDVFWITPSAADSSSSTAADPLSTQQGDIVRSHPVPMSASVPSAPHQAAAMTTRLPRPQHPLLQLLLPGLQAQYLQHQGINDW